MESVLRYGLPANYFAVVIKVRFRLIVILLSRSNQIILQPAPKQATKLLAALSAHLVGTISPSAQKVKKVGKSSTADDAAAGEYANVLEGEYYDFVVFEIEKIE